MKLVAGLGVLDGVVARLFMGLLLWVWICSP